MSRLRRLRRLTAAAAACAALAASAPGRQAHADPPKKEPAAPAWGWTVAALSVAAGAAVTTASVAVTCPQNDFECARWTSLGIWGGIGIASIGSLVGLLSVTAASRARPRVHVSFAVHPSQHGAAMPRASFAYTF